jgi:hypothetical protein
MEETLITQTRNDTLREKLQKVKKPNSFLYNIQMNNTEKENVSAENKWKQTIDDNTSVEWKNVYLMPFKATIDTSLRSFQYKFVMRLIPTNTYLFTCKLTTSRLCDFCCMHSETLEHLFWECHVIQNLWNQVGNYLKSKNINTRFDLLNICFGIDKPGQLNDCLNYIIILCKFYIYKMKQVKQTPCTNMLLKYIDYRISLEKEIALRNDKLEIYNTKWQRFIN